MNVDFRQRLNQGLVIPAHPLALNSRRQLDEQRQRALSQYYIAAGAGGLAVGVHTTQFAIRDPRFSMLEPVLRLAAEEMNASNKTLVRIAGICGETSQAIQEAELSRSLGYHAGLLSLAALRNADVESLLLHCQRIAEILPIVGFYLQPSVGGRVLPYAFWRRFAEIENVVAMKIAPFNRYQTLDVIRAVIEADRDDIALYTGNDDNIVADLLTQFSFGNKSRRIVGGLLGHWSVWTRSAVELLERCKSVVQRMESTHSDTIHTMEQPLQFEREIYELLRVGVEVTDCNAAFFDAANGYRGCIAGLHEVLRRQGLLDGIWCLDESEGLSPGQMEEIDRVYTSYPLLNDDNFVKELA